MGRSSAFLVAIAVSIGSCAPAPMPAAVVVAPMPKSYSCDQLTRMAAEFGTLPAGSAIAAAMDDYRIERKQLRALHGLPEPAACPAEPQ